MSCLDPINYPSLTPSQNEYLESIRDKLELNNCNLTNKQDIYLGTLYYGMNKFKDEKEFIEVANKLYGFINFGMSEGTDGNWQNEWGGGKDPLYTPDYIEAFNNLYYQVNYGLSGNATWEDEW